MRLLLPINIEEMKQIANDGVKMPPKSTFIQPKVRRALTVYEFKCSASSKLKN